MKFFKTKNKKSNEEKIIKLLASIDMRLSMFEKCVKYNDYSHGNKNYIVTGHWND